jgi:hypothetical protein
MKRTLLVCIGLVAVAGTSGCTSTHSGRAASEGVAAHPCSKNPFLRSVGFFGGEQPEVFSSGPHLRSEPPPSVDVSTRFLNVSDVDNLSDSLAQPVIDKCGSSLQLVDKGEVEVTILFKDQNCPGSFDEEDAEDCRSRARFGFSSDDLGIGDLLESSQDPNAALRKLLLVDAYFTREIRPEGRHSMTGVRSIRKNDVYLVVRVIRAGHSTDPESASTRGAARELRATSRLPRVM